MTVNELLKSKDINFSRESMIRIRFGTTKEDLPFKDAKNLKHKNKEILMLYLIFDKKGKVMAATCHVEG